MADDTIQRPAPLNTRPDDGWPETDPAAEQHAEAITRAANRAARTNVLPEPLEGEDVSEEEALEAEALAAQDLEAAEHLGEHPVI